MNLRLGFQGELVFASVATAKRRQACSLFKNLKTRRYRPLDCDAAIVHNAYKIQLLDSTNQLDSRYIFLTHLLQPIQDTVQAALPHAGRVHSEAALGIGASCASFREADGKGSVLWLRRDVKVTDVEKPRRRL